MFGFLDKNFSMVRRNLLLKCYEMKARVPGKLDFFVHERQQD